MATISLPLGRSIEVTATVNAALRQRAEIQGPDLEHQWEGHGEGKRIGQAAIEFPPGEGSVELEVNLSHAGEDGTWNLSHVTVIESRERGEIHVMAEDGRGALDGNDLIVRFRWVV